MSSIGTSKGVLEIVKFAVYVSVPIGLMYIFANNNKNLQKIMGHVPLLWWFGSRIGQCFDIAMASIASIASIEVQQNNHPFVDRRSASFQINSSLQSLLTIAAKLTFKREYVVYPTETVIPQSPEELREIAKEIGRKRERDQAMRS